MLPARSLRPCARPCARAPAPLHLRPGLRGASRALLLVPALLAALVPAAGSALAAPARTAARPAAAAAQPMRLPDTVQPLAYRLHLQIDPDQPRHQGEVQIDLRLRQPLPARGAIRLHAKALQWREVWLEIGARRWRGRVVQVDGERVDLFFGQPLAAGAATLQIGFAGRMAEHDVYGLFRQQEGTQGGAWGAYTQFQPTAARQVFPLFDEPGFKVPFTLSLTVPQALAAFSNMPVQQEQPVGSGWKRLDFAPTPPMPAYLLAFGIGRLEVLDAGRAGRGAAQGEGVPLRFIVPAGRSADAAYAAANTASVLARLEAYFDLPYPYAKLDSLALPLTSNFGAMEHAGLVTYASSLLLASPAEHTPQFERDYVATAAHELAHQWFGNLVTLAWWDDLWLNESFASWLGDKITDEVKPAWHWHLSAQHARARAMRSDRLASARRIEQPVLQDDDIGNLFDAITYDKGQAVLGMFEAWLGPAAFQAGVRRYISRHAWGTATSADFFHALADTDATLPAALRSFTTQGGIPRLALRLVCGDGPPRLELQQSRLLPLGSALSAEAAAQRWQLPLLLRTPAGTSRLLMATPQASLPLPDAQCPAWVQANAGGTGYWRSAWLASEGQASGDGLLRLAAAPGLPTGEWLVLLDDALGLHAAGDVSSAQALALVRAAAGHPSHEVQRAAVALLRHLRPLVSPAQQAAYAAQWQAAFGDRARRLGWQPRADDSDDDRLLRPLLLPALATLGDDSSLQQEALQLAQGWLDTRAGLAGASAAVPADLRLAIFTAAAQASGAGGGAALFDRLLAAWRASTVRTERGDLLAALGQFRQPGLPERARALLLEPQVDLRDSLWPLLRAQAADAGTRSAALDFTVRHRSALAARLGQEDQPHLPGLFSTGCSADEASRMQAGFGPAAAALPGGRAALARALEAVRLCSAWRALQPSGLAP